MSKPTFLATKNLLTTPPTRAFISSRCLLPHTQQRQYASDIFANAPPEGASVAILGGGITGLVSAYELSSQRPDLKIKLLEGSNRLGGWLQSTSVDVGTGKVVFEQGPRSLRPAWPNGHITLDLVDRLGLSDRLLMTSKASPAAQNRFIYYPDHLVRMPGPGLSTWGNYMNIVEEPILIEALQSLLKEFWTRRRPPELQDESIGSFISRRFGSALADNIASAVFHGIYAGDIYKLSARSIMPATWALEAMRGYGPSVVQGQIFCMIKKVWPVSRSSMERAHLNMLATKRSPSKAAIEARNSSVFTFKNGVGELAKRLEEELIAQPNISIYKGCMVENLELQGHGRNAKIELITKDLSSTKMKKEAWEFSHVISTISSKNLASVVSKSKPLYSLSKTRSVTVMVVNLYYKNPSLVSVKGFGYLLPRSLPVTQNPERALGVIFDSDATLGQDAVEGTKLTVMLGGHWWDDFDGYPSEDEGAAMARSVLQRHLRITETPRAVHVSLQRDCIPQYEVGHDQRMEKADGELQHYEGRLRVAGNSYTGVGLNDCVKAATMCAYNLTYGKDNTGLGVFAGDAPVVLERTG